MRTAEERISLLHKRAREIERKKENRGLFSSATYSALLLCFMMGATARFSSLPGREERLQYAASSLLGESAGGYVLVAVIAFSVGVILTTILRRHHKADKNNKQLSE